MTQLSGLFTNHPFALVEARMFGQSVHRALTLCAPGNLARRYVSVTEPSQPTRPESCPAGCLGGSTRQAALNRQPAIPLPAAGCVGA